MSALLTHALVGVLLGMALRLPLRQLPLAALLAIFPDFDHLDMVWGASPLHSRTSFANVLVCIALPLAVFAAWRYRRAPPSWQRLALVAPLLLATHLLLDMLSIDLPGDTQGVALFYPFTDAWFSFREIRLDRIHPAEYSTTTVVLLILTLATVATILVERALASARPGLRRGALGAYAGAWLLLFPALFAGGFVISAPRHVDAELAIDMAEFRFPESRLIARIVLVEGEAAPPGALNLTLALSGGTRLDLTNPTRVEAGAPWIVNESVSTSAERVTAATLRLAAKSALDPFLYARANATIVPAHVPAVLNASATPTPSGNVTFAIQHVAGPSIPPRALRLVALAENATAPFANQTNALRLNESETWSLDVKPPSGKAYTLQLVSVDDGFVYARVEAPARP